jgi:hypothetical protein
MKAKVSKAKTKPAKAKKTSMGKKLSKRTSKIYSAFLLS